MLGHVPINHVPGMHAHQRGVASVTTIFTQQSTLLGQVEHRQHISQAEQVHGHLLRPQRRKKSHTSNTRHKQKTSSKRGPFLLLASNHTTRGIPWNHTPPSMIHIHTQPENCQCGALLYNIKTQGTATLGTVCHAQTGGVRQHLLLCVCFSHQYPPP